MEYRSENPNIDSRSGTLTFVREGGNGFMHREQRAITVTSGAGRSGFDDMGASTQTMQRDDLLDPKLLWVLEGEQLRNRPVGAAGRSCASASARAAVVSSPGCRRRAGS